MKIGLNLTFIKGNINFGIGLFCKQLIEGLLINDKNIKITVFINADNAFFIEKAFRNKNIKFIKIGGKKYFNKKITNIINNFYFLKKALKNELIDVWINPCVNLYTVLASNAININVIHDLHYKYYPQYYNFIFRKLIDMKIKKILLKSNAIVAISNYVKMDILKNFEKININNIIVIANPIEYNKKYNDIKEKSIINNKYILSVNSFEEWKNQITLLKAFNLIKNKINYDLLLIGYGNPEYLYRYIHNNKLDDRVSIKQNIEEDILIEYYKNAELFINTSMFEGFGRANIEAGMMMVPVLSSTEMCLKDVSFGMLNYYEPANDEYVLSEKILECLENKNLRSKHILNKIKNRFLLEYNKKKIADEYINLINNIKG